VLVRMISLQRRMRCRSKLSVNHLEALAGKYRALVDLSIQEMPTLCNSQVLV